MYKAYVYIMQEAGTPNCKIGVTDQLPERLRSLRAKHKKNLIIVLSLESHNPYQFENGLHTLFKEQRINVGKEKEWFVLSESDIELVKTLDPDSFDYKAALEIEYFRKLPANEGFGEYIQ